MPDYALASLGTKVISALTTGPYLGESIFMGTSSELGKVFGNFALESLLYPLRSLFGKTSLKSQPPWIAITVCFFYFLKNFSLIIPQEIVIHFQVNMESSPLNYPKL